MAEVLGALGQWTLYALWTLLLTAASLCVYLGLGGTFLVLGLALAHAALTGFSPITLHWLLWLLALAALGEGLEFLIGSFYAAGRGASKWSVVSAFVVGLLGAAVGNSLVPVLGAVLGSFIGAFLGAVLGEYAGHRRLERSLRVGLAACVGRIGGILVKHVIALIMVFLVLRLTLPH